MREGREQTAKQIQSSQGRGGVCTTRQENKEKNAPMRGAREDFPEKGVIRPLELDLKES